MVGRGEEGYVDEHAGFPLKDRISPDGPGPSDTEDLPTEDRSWVRLSAAILFVVVVAGSFTYLMRDELANPVVNDTAFGPMITDTFDRPGDPSLLGEVGNEVWESVSGVWGVDAGRAIVSEADADGTSVALLITAETGTIEARVGGSGLCGVLARWGASDGEIALFRVGGFGVWNLVRIVNGENEFLASLPFSPGRDLAVRLTVGERLVVASVDGAEVSVVLDGVEAELGGFGLVAFGDDAATCSWDDVSINRGR